MKRLLTFLLLLLSLGGLAQNPQGLVSYDVKYPLGTITQGEWINVQYTLEAADCSVTGVETVPGLLLETIAQSEMTLKKGTRRIYVGCNFSVNAHGRIALPRLNVTVDGVPVGQEQIFIDVRPNPKYGREWEYAREFLVKRGVNPTQLAARYSGETLVAFSDAVQKVFAIVCTKAYEQYMDYPVLAYGMGNSMWDGQRGSGDNTIYHIIGLYDAQLKLLKQKNEKYHSIPGIMYMRHPEGVKPLLGDINYGQRKPYNDLFPKERYKDRDSTCLAGCGPVALAQVLSYHKSPVQPCGTGRLKTESGRQYEIRMQDNPISWDGSPASLASLMLDAAASVNAVTAPDGSSSSLVNFKGALLNNWNYSPQCTYVPKLQDMTMLQFVYSDLDAGRPVIAADQAHIFVIDGYYRDFLHLNLGWNGYCNGYYRAVIVQSDRRRQLPFNEILCGIRPREENENLSLAVKVKKPGQFQAALAKEMKKKKNAGREVVSMKVSGKINGFDIAVIRRMAGAVPYREYDAGHGSLMELDLSDATIQRGGRYATLSANKMTFSGAVTNGGVTTPYRYDMAHLGPHQWAEMQALGLTKGDTWTIQADDDGGHSVSWYASEKTIGPHMFEGCQNLRSVVLPKDTKEVMGNAFFGCRTLQSVKGLPMKVADNAFENTLLGQGKN
ncbi:MAG: C10 family peptidase [Bacteroidales bacterium]|nr:C10 family peptidase [Bacteroidales bacterium]